jgi:hypothetical protein
MTIRARRFAAAGALAVSAVAAPIAIALSVGSATESVAGPACLAWYGNREDGVCLSYSNGNGMNVGTPDMGVYGPSNNAGGVGLTTGNLLPGQTWNSPVG